MFDFSIVTHWIDNLLRSVMPGWGALLVEFVLVGVVLLLLYAVLALFYIYFERKVCAFFQCRLGPNRVGPYGIIQSVADMFKIIGAIRSGAQMVSYELSIGLSVLTMVVFAGTMSITGIVEAQTNGWFLFTGHIPAIVAFLIYLVAGTAETNRGPFDLPEAESELTAGYHTEYSGIHFGFFYLAEYLNLFIVSGMATLLFLGGWMPFHIPGWEGFNHIMDYIPSVIWFFGKAILVSFVIIWFKWTFPRLRIDQLLRLEWKYLLPLNLINLFIMVLIVIYGLHF